MKDKGILQIFAEGIRQTLVTVYDVGQRMTGTGDAFPAGFALAVEELSFRLLGEHFDAYEERVRAALRDRQIDALAAEFEQVMENEVLEGRCELVIGADGTKRYSPHESALKSADQQQARSQEGTSEPLATEKGLIDYTSLSGELAEALRKCQEEKK